ncbi:ATP-dependent RNA helicase RhlB [Ectothiorhodospira mobilis]|uniref:ATP-dependent RNA helicase RhlB n=1 Tax=Ectothiorhodospira mobilis TaxID=195064 RepID=UPI001EE80124|nr:ATP-dependent RNA helicase RhlB [Ectothiorhodospira mobilis]MCG5536437.1 ATP-dependent RNA helicase RhlB [Ectothiorhodospira mobilis]
MTDQHLSDISFSRFPLPEAVQQGLADAGFSRCTPIQALALPPILAGQDVAGQAQTGTGKTAAFLIGVFTHLLQHPAPAERRPQQIRALILAPTRELALQIHRDAQVLGRHTGLVLGLAYGGTDYDRQRRQLSEGVDLLIGTPGRIIDYHKQGVFDLHQVQTLVLDEADRMFDLGFIKDVRFLLRRAPAPDRRQSMLFSATLSYRVMELAYEHMNNPVKVQTEDEQVTAKRVRQAVYYPANDQKIPLLLGLMHRLEPERAMVFVNTRHMAERVTAWLQANGIQAALLSGDVPQRKRERLLQQFEDGVFRALVATDVAARGLHIPDVSHVFNFDLPQSGEDYVHRIGRTGRAGAEGDAISFACEDSAFHLPEIEAYIGAKIPAQMTDASVLAEDLTPPAKRPPRPRDGHRGKNPGPREGGKGRGGQGRQRAAGDADPGTANAGGKDGNTGGPGSPNPKAARPDQTARRKRGNRAPRRRQDNPGHPPSSGE